MGRAQCEVGVSMLGVVAFGLFVLEVRGMRSAPSFIPRTAALPGWAIFAAGALCFPV